MFGCTEMAVIKRIRVHFHKHHDAVEREEDLSGPSPAKHERPINPQCKPSGLVNTLDWHPAPFPPQPSSAIAEQFM